MKRVLAAAAVLIILTACGSSNSGNGLPAGVNALSVDASGVGDSAICATLSSGFVGLAVGSYPVEFKNELSAGLTVDIVSSANAKVATVEVTAGATVNRKINFPKADSYNITCTSQGNTIHVTGFGVPLKIEAA